ncbi:MAG: two-component system OmpR family sensor kinase [Sulfurimonas sp.]|jgi:two-component system OmpR family sensor kinase
MNKNSIIFSITATFVIALVLILLSFFIIFQSSKNREANYVERMNRDATKMFLREHKHRGFSQELVGSLRIVNFSVITDPIKQNKILNDKDTKYLHVEKRGRPNRVVEFMKLNSKYYISIHTDEGIYLLVNNNVVNTHFETILLVFLLILITFIFLYITTIKKLKPLKALQQKVENFGAEEFDIKCATSKKDEISLLANEFDKSAKKLKHLKESRNIFIRNIMHELKTPITKGQFLTQLPQTEENSEKMQKVFFRLDALINEFASIEELLASKKVLETKEYYLEDILDNSIDILMCNDNQVIKECDNIKLNVNFKLFSIAVKNLLDNGIKYSVDKSIKVKTQDGNMVFENIGEEMKYPLKSYCEAFFKGSDVKSNQSFGLGLYIVKHILDANNYNLEYTYEKGINKFMVIQQV